MTKKGRQKYNLCVLVDSSGESRWGQIRPWPSIEVGNGVWHPLGGRKSNDSTVNMSKSKDFGPPRINFGYGFGLPTENDTLNTSKRAMTKIRSKISEKIWPTRF